tara:strand:+ start:163 stop:789 length:627 start_codon:yes stop_codon:yes gene_type:complete
MNYSSLVTQIKNFLEDDSTEFATSIDSIIVQAEEMIFQRLPNLPCFRKIHTGNLVQSQSDYAIAGARMIRQVSITHSGGSIYYIDHRVDSYLRDYHPSPTAEGVPTMYSTKTAPATGTTITLGAVPNSTNAYQVDYIAPETGLSSGNATSWVGNNLQTVLLSACLYESSAFLKAPETVTLYKAQFDESIQSSQQEMLRDWASEYNGGI